jgi:hypothetical protein
VALLGALLAGRGGDGGPALTLQKPLIVAAVGYVIAVGLA